MHGVSRSMRIPVRILFTVLVGLGLASVSRAAEIPKDLPQYDLNIKLDTGARLATVHQKTTWTNRSDRSTKQLQFNFYPHYKIPDGDYFLLAKTLELLRQTPDDGIDRGGRHGQIQDIAWANPRGEKQRLRYSYREDNASALTVDLIDEVQPGQRTTDSTSRHRDWLTISIRRRAGTVCGPPCRDVTIRRDDRGLEPRRVFLLSAGHDHIKGFVGESLRSLVGSGRTSAMDGPVRRKRTAGASGETQNMQRRDITPTLGEGVGVLTIRVPSRCGEISVATLADG